MCKNILRAVREMPGYEPIPDGGRRAAVAAPRRAGRRGRVRRVRGRARRAAAARPPRPPRACAPSARRLPRRGRRRALAPLRRAAQRLVGRAGGGRGRPARVRDGRPLAVVEGDHRREHRRRGPPMGAERDRDPALARARRRRDRRGRRGGVRRVQHRGGRQGPAQHEGARARERSARSLSSPNVPSPSL